MEQWAGSTSRTVIPWSHDGIKLEMPLAPWQANKGSIPHGDVSKIYLESAAVLPAGSASRQRPHHAGQDCLSHEEL